MSPAAVSPIAAWQRLAQPDELDLGLAGTGGLTERWWPAAHHVVADGASRDALPHAYDMPEFGQAAGRVRGVFPALVLARIIEPAHQQGRGLERAAPSH